MMGDDPIATGTPAGASEQRRFPRYRLAEPVIVRVSDVSEVRGMSVAISEGGMSAVMGADLKVGERVELEPVGGGATSAVVRHAKGKLCGFEFLDLSPQQAERIRGTCAMLPLYRSKTLDLWKVSH